MACLCDSHRPQRGFEHADAPHALALLRARRERPRAAAPPSSVMNSRRLTRSPRRRHQLSGRSSSILWIEPFIYNFLCLGNNRFFGTFLKALRDFRAAQMTSREEKSSPSSHFRLG